MDGATEGHAQGANGDGAQHSHRHQRQQGDSETLTGGLSNAHGRATETEAWLRASAGDLAAVLGQTADAYAWIRTLDEWPRRFHDPGQHDVAVGQAKVECREGDLRCSYMSVVT